MASRRADFFPLVSVYWYVPFLGDEDPGKFPRKALLSFSQQTVRVQNDSSGVQLQLAGQHRRMCSPFTAVVLRMCWSGRCACCIVERTVLNWCAGWDQSRLRGTTTEVVFSHQLAALSDMKLRDEMASAVVSTGTYVPLQSMRLVPG